MKRIIFILLLLCALAASAQSHLEFNGIPIDGSVSAFTEKMKKIGYVVDPVSKSMPAGQRWFADPDRDVTVCVSYDVKSKNVFCVSQIFQFNNAVACRRFFDGMKKRLSSRYVETDSCGSGEMESVDGLPFYGVDVNNADCEFIGTITCRIEYDATVPENMFVFVEFSDGVNSGKYFKP
ncbi:MAG: hypothetical protein J6L79_08920 [Muribaculaceae bacterium]|nr:hypothetical protein [Muribaculaceae bacterium]